MHPRQRVEVPGHLRVIGVPSTCCFIRWIRPRGESISSPHSTYVGHVGRQNPQCTQCRSARASGPSSDPSHEPAGGQIRAGVEPLLDPPHQRRARSPGPSGRPGARAPAARRARSACRRAWPRSPRSARDELGERRCADVGGQGDVRTAEAADPRTRAGSRAGGDRPQRGVCDGRAGPAAPSSTSSRAGAAHQPGRLGGDPRVRAVRPSAPYGERPAPGPPSPRSARPR